MAQGKLEEAEVLSRRALEGRERVLGVDHPKTLISVNNLGSLLQAQGKLEEAEVSLPPSSWASLDALRSPLLVTRRQSLRVPSLTLSSSVRVLLSKKQPSSTSKDAAL